MFKSQEFPIGLATNSPRKLIDIALYRLRIIDFFDVLVSVEDVKNGKPEPDIYHEAALRLGVNEPDCVVFEDSINGMTAAKRAGMTVIVVPEPEQIEHPKFTNADYILESLSEFKIEDLSYVNRNRKEAP